MLKKTILLSFVFLLGGCANSSNTLVENIIDKVFPENKENKDIRETSINCSSKVFPKDHFMVADTMTETKIGIFFSETGKRDGAYRMYSVHIDYVYDLECETEADWTLVEDYTKRSRESFSGTDNLGFHQLTPKKYEKNKKK